VSGETDLELMASTLEASGRYRVLRKLESRRVFATPDGSPIRLGILLDFPATRSRKRNLRRRPIDPH